MHVHHRLVESLSVVQIHVKVVFIIAHYKSLFHKMLSVLVYI